MKTIFIIFGILALSQKSTSAPEKECVDQATNCPLITKFCNKWQYVAQLCPRSCSTCNKRTSICVFPFIFAGVEYTACARDDEDDGRLWCSTKTDDHNNHIGGGGHWTHCDVDCKCGKSNEPLLEIEPSSQGSKLRIVGGRVALKNKYPWLVHIRIMPQFMFCGGSIINTRYILTAGHCTYKEHCTNPVKPEELTVVVAEHNWQSINDDIKGVTEYIKVKKVIRHENYCRYPNSMTSFDHDIALLLLPKDIDLSHKELGLPCLPPTPWTKYEGKTVSAAGWGFNHPSGPIAGTFASDLLEVSFKVLEGCGQYPIKKHITSNMICAGDPEAVKDACGGDSGGPLMYKDENNRYTQVGIVSFGPPGANCTGVGVYTRVAHYIDWIRENTKDGECII